MPVFTKEQEDVLDASGNIIVSASAGSGKTTVMIEKIIRLIKSGVKVSQLLAVTFTRKAASQMKEKLRKELIKAINDPACKAEDRKALKEQLAAVPSAAISTIHSFCADLIRSNFFAVGVDNSFSILMSDDPDASALSGKAVGLLFDEAYETGEKDFLKLLSVYWRSKSDNALRKIFTETYEKLRDRADYKEFLSQSGQFSEELFDTICAELLENLQEKCKYYQALLAPEYEYFQAAHEAEVQEAEELAQQKGKKAKAVKERAGYATCKVLSDIFDAILSAPNYFSACAFQKPAIPSKEQARETDDELRRYHVERVAAIRSKVDDIFKKELSVTLSREEELANFLASGEIARALVKYLLRYDDLLTELKRERNALDCNDLEHLTLKLLENEEILQSVRQKYTHVFVDEYQDVNPVQEKILSLVAGENVFLVGDVKQSIYGFRGSRSEYFLQKQKLFDELNGAHSLYLSRNFRSSDKVLDAVNSQLKIAMTTTNVGMDYYPSSYMEKGGMYALNSGDVQIHFVQKEEKTTDTEKRGIYSVKGNYARKKGNPTDVAKKIKEIILRECNKQWFDADSQSMKRITYSDIAILARKKSGGITKVVSYLTGEGIPVTTNASVNVCEYPEIKTLIDILSLLDNTKQDVPLCSALLSSMGDLTADDLTTIRLTYPSEHFFRDACQKYAEEQTDMLSYKLKKFYTYFNELRLQATTLGAGSLLTKIISDTRMEARLISKENGVGCMKRIHRFIEETLSPEPLSVHEFLQRLKALDYEIKFNENGGEEAVRVMTMHASKGLEFPIVILYDLNETFHGADRDYVLVEETYGLAPKAYNVKEMQVSNTLLRRLYDKKEQEHSVRDELNLYYVALTRAKYGLHMVFTEQTGVTDVRYARSFADFTDFDVWSEFINNQTQPVLQELDRKILASMPDDEITGAIIDAFLWKYPYNGFENLPVKSSAMALIQSDFEQIKAVKLFQTSDNAREELQAKKQFNQYLLPMDTQTNREEEKERTTRGLAYHAYLEHFDFSLLYDETFTPVDRETLKERICQQLQFLQESKAIEEEYLPYLDAEKLTDILSNPVFLTLKDCALYKERQFLAGLTPSEVLSLKAQRGTFGDEVQLQETDDEIIFQGALDLLAVGENSVRIIDYKYSSKDEKYLREHYALQLALYKKVTSKILKIPPENISCTIVNIALGFQVEMDEI